MKLDLRLVECDQFRLPLPLPVKLMDPVNQLLATDGIELDAYGNPITYYMLRYHPGNIGIFAANPLQFDKVDAASVVHWYRGDRPGQHRGVPEILSSLSLYAMLRRYTLATTRAAEVVAAMGAFVVESAGSADPEDVPPAWMTLELDHGMMTTLPYGYKANQMKPEHPTTTYPEFKHELLNEAARSKSMPYNIAAGNSSGYNYASGRLDHQTYYKGVGMEQDDLEIVVLDPLFDAWIQEATLVDGLLPQQARMRDAVIDHQWFWDGTEHVDPEKEANADETRLRTGTTTYQRIYAEAGCDWEAEMQNNADALGVSLDEYRALLRQSLFAQKPGGPAGGSGKPQPEEETANAA